MQMNDRELTQYEEVVNNIVNDSLVRYSGRFAVEIGGSSVGGWEVKIIPVNPKAASVYISEVNGHTIYMAVDDAYLVEFHVSGNDYKEKLPDFASHFRAVLRGDVVGYHVKNQRNYESNPYMKTVLDFKIKNSTTRHGRNVVFSGLFTRREDVIRQDFESY